MNTRVVILCAGHGTRMGADIPKPLVEVSGRPMVHHLIDAVKESGVDENPILVVSPSGLTHFGDICVNEGCEYAIQEEQLGTGHAAMAAKEKAGDADRIIVLYGDHPFVTSQIIESLNVAMQEGNKLTMLTTKVPNFTNDYQGFRHWGRVIREINGSISAIREYKDATEEEREIKEVNPGMYGFEAEWLWDHLEDLSNENASGEYYLTELIEMASEEEIVIKTVLAENPFEVMGINSKEELERAERIMG